MIVYESSCRPFWMRRSTAAASAKVPSTERWTLGAVCVCVWLLYSDFNADDCVSILRRMKRCQWLVENFGSRKFSDSAAMSMGLSGGQVAHRFRRSGQQKNFLNTLWFLQMKTLVWVWQQSVDTFRIIWINVTCAVGLTVALLLTFLISYWNENLKITLFNQSLHIS